MFIYPITELGSYGLLRSFSDVAEYAATSIVLEIILLAESLTIAIVLPKFKLSWSIRSRVDSIVSVY